MKQPPPGGRHGLVNERYRIPFPKTVKEIPYYLKRLISGNMQ